MQRYGVYYFGTDPDETEPLVGGPWVRADEAEAELATLRAALRNRELKVGREVKNVETLRAEVERQAADIRTLTRHREERNAEVERLREVSAAHRAAWDNADTGRKAAESSLAAATALLERAADELEGDIYDDDYVVVALRGQLRAFLATQPAAPARAEFAACRAEADRLRGLMCRKPEAATPEPAETFGCIGCFP